MSDKKLIQVQGLKKYYNGGANKALDGISLDIDKGEVVVIIGPSGSGKSTLLRSLNLLEMPTEGHILVDGVDITDPKVNINLHRQKMGMVFQHFNLFPHMTILKNMIIAPMKLQKKSEAEATELAMKLLERVGLADRANAYPSQLSGGQKQRIAIAGVLAMKPKCIVLDEPTAMLDPVGRRDVMETIERLNREEGITMILITHYMDEAVRADKVFVIDDGDLVMQGTPKEIFSQVETLQKYGLDVPQVTEVAYLLRKEGVELPADILTIEEMVGAICRLKSTI